MLREILFVALVVAVVWVLIFQLLLPWLQLVPVLRRALDDEGHAGVEPRLGNGRACAFVRTDNPRGSNSVITQRTTA
jgi:hypothetical protein